MTSCNCKNEHVCASHHQHRDPRSLNTSTHKQPPAFSQSRGVGEGTHAVAVVASGIRDDGATEGDHRELGELGVHEVADVGEL